MPDSDAAPQKIEDSHVAQERTKILVIDYGSQYTQLITRRCDLPVNQPRGWPFAQPPALVMQCTAPSV